MSRRAVLVVVAGAYLAGAGAAVAQVPGFAQAMSLFDGQHWAQAADAFQQLETASPGKTSALLYLGKCYINMRKFEDADSTLQSYAAAHPESDEALYLLAYVRFRQNQPAESLRFSTRAAQIRRPQADDLKIVGLDYVLLDDLPSAERYLGEAVALEPKNVEAMYALGRVLYQENKFDRSIAAFQDVLQMDPRNEKAQGNLGLAWEGKNETEKAIAAYRKAIEMDDGAFRQDEQPFLNLGMLLTKLNQAEEAVPLLRRACEIAPQTAKAHLELGRTYFSLNRMEDAERELVESARLQPQDSAPHYLLGRLYHRIGKSEESKKEFAITDELIRAKRRNSSSGMQDSPEPRMR